MSNNNAINFPNQTAKTTPTISDLVLISDQAASGALKQSPISGFPTPTALLTTDNLATVASFCACMPGAFSTVQSDTQAQGMNVAISTTGFLVIPFYVGVAWTTTSMGIIVKTGVAASTVTMGIYASSNGEPTGAPLANGSATTTANNTLVTASVVASLSANTLYWAGIQASTPTTLAFTVVEQNFAAPNFFLYVGSSGSWGMNTIGYTNTYSAGTLPTIVPGNLYGTSFNYLPVIRIK